MFSSCLIGIVCGALLGLRFKVFAIVAIEILGLVGLAGMAAVGHVTLGRAALMFLCWSAGLQMGYVTMLVAAAMAPRASRVTTSRA